MQQAGYQDGGIGSSGIGSRLTGMRALRQLPTAWQARRCYIFI